MAHSSIVAVDENVSVHEENCIRTPAFSLSSSLSYPHLTSMARVKKCSLEHVFRLDDKTADTNRLRRMLHRHFAFITAAEKFARSLSLAHALSPHYSCEKMIAITIVVVVVEIHQVLDFYHADILQSVSQIWTS